MIKLKVFLFALLPTLFAAYIIWVKVTHYKISIWPDSDIKAWHIEAHVKTRGTGRSARIELELPVVLEKHEILSENFISNGFAVAILNGGDSRKAVWTGRAADKDYDFYYRAVLKRAPDFSLVRKPPDEETIKEQSKSQTAIKEFLKELKQATKNSDTNYLEVLCEQLNKGSWESAVQLRNLADGSRSLIDLTAQVIQQAKIPVRIVKAIKLEDAERGTRFLQVLEVNQDDRWRAIDYRNGRQFSDRWLVWRRSADPLLSTHNLNASNVKVSVTPELAAPGRPAVADAVFERFPSVQRLPVDAQAVYSIILVIPVGALVVAFIRSIVGIKTLGTFMPVLIALSFRETELLWGLILYITVIVLSLIVRYFFEHLQLLVVPRLTATMSLVVIVIFLFSCLMEYLHLDRALSVALFPIVILTMMIERISIIWEELGLVKAAIQTVVSLSVASLIYLVISDRYVQYYMVVFPELLLVVLSSAILLGRFTGYRLTELYRFRSFLRNT